MKMAEQPNPDVFGSNASELASEYNCVVVKAGTNVLTGGKDELDLAIMEDLVRQLAWLHSRGVKVLLVTSGAIAAGLKVLGMDEDKTDMSYRQMLASVGQSRLLQIYSSLFFYLFVFVLILYILNKLKNKTQNGKIVKEGRIAMTKCSFDQKKNRFK